MASVLKRDPAASKKRIPLSPLVLEALTAPSRFGDESRWQKIWAEISSLILVRRTGDIEGEDLEARLARAEVRLGEGDLAAAVAEIGAIKDAARTPLEDWLADARTRLEVTEAATRLELLIDESARPKE